MILNSNGTIGRLIGLFWSLPSCRWWPLWGWYLPGQQPEHSVSPECDRCPGKWGPSLGENRTSSGGAHPDQCYVKTWECEALHFHHHKSWSWKQKHFSRAIYKLKVKIHVFMQLIKTQIDFWKWNLLKFSVYKKIVLLCEITMAKWWKQVNGEKRREKCPAIPGISLSKLQLQSMVDLIMSVSISDMQNIFTWQKEKGVTTSIHKAQLSSCDASPNVPSLQTSVRTVGRCGRLISRTDTRTLNHG